MISLTADLIFTVGFGLSLLMVHASSRRLMLYLGVTYSCLYALSLFLKGADAGAVTCLIAAGITIINAICPDDKLSQTFKLRVTVIFFLSIIAACFFVREMTDILPFISTIGARFAETLDSRQKIRRGYAITALIWAMYIVSTGNIFIALLEISRLLNIVYSIHKNDRENRLIEQPA